MDIPISERNRLSRGGYGEVWCVDTHGEIILSSHYTFVKQKRAKLIKKSHVMLWNEYANHKGDYLEFKEDATYLRSLSVGKWRIQGDIIKFT